MAEYRILIIEDDITIQTQLNTLLTGNGYDVSGQERVKLGDRKSVV